MKDIAFALVIAAATLLVPSAADACSCPRGVLRVSPSDGAADVPVNAEIKVMVAGLQGELAFRLTTTGGEEVPLTVLHVGGPDAEYRLIRPATQLAANTTYTLRHEEIGSGQGQVEVTTFTTGADRDDVAPVNGARPQMRRYDDRKTLFESQCGGGVGYTTEIAAASDDRSPVPDVWYHVYVGRGADSIDFATLAGAALAGDTFIGSGACGTKGPFPDDDSEWVIALAAVDVAGNEAAPTEPIVPAGCGCGSAPGGGASLAVGALALLGLRRIRWTRAG